MSFKSSYNNIPRSTLVKAYGIDGNLVAKWHYREECRTETASLALAISAASTLNVPRQSIRLVWAALETMPPDDSATATSPAHVANVQLVLAPLNLATDSEDDFVMIHDGGTVLFTCQCCADPCDDADHVFRGSRARIDNCVRCMPCFLCVACRVQIPWECGHWNPLVGSHWVCFDCLEPAERRFLNTIQLNRYSLACPHCSFPEID